MSTLEENRGTSICPGRGTIASRTVSDGFDHNPLRSNPVADQFSSYSSSLRLRPLEIVSQSYRARKVARRVCRAPHHTNETDSPLRGEIQRSVLDSVASVAVKDCCFTREIDNRQSGLVRSRRKQRWIGCRPGWHAVQSRAAPRVTGIEARIS